MKLSMSKDDLINIISNAESVIYKNSKSLRNLLFDDNYTNLILDFDNIKYSIEIRLNIIQQSLKFLNELYLNENSLSNDSLSDLTNNLDDNSSNNLKNSNDSSLNNFTNLYYNTNNITNLNQNSYNNLTKNNQNNLHNNNNIRNNNNPNQSYNNLNHIIQDNQITPSTTFNNKTTISDSKTKLVTISNDYMNNTYSDNKQSLNNFQHNFNDTCFNTPNNLIENDFFRHLEEDNEEKNNNEDKEDYQLSPDVTFHSSPDYLMNHLYNTINNCTNNAKTTNNVPANKHTNNLTHQSNFIDNNTNNSTTNENTPISNNINHFTDNIINNTDNKLNCSQSQTNNNNNKNDKNTPTTVNNFFYNTNTIV